MEARISEVSAEMLANSDISSLASTELASFVRSLLAAIGRPSTDSEHQINAIRGIIAFTSGESAVIGPITLPAGHQLRALRRTATAELARHLHAAGHPDEALQLAEALFEESKQTEDTVLQMTSALLQSEILISLDMVGKARGAAVSAASAASQVYVKPNVQCQLDVVNAALASAEGDPNSAVSYFLEALDNAASSSSRYEREANACTSNAEKSYSMADSVIYRDMAVLTAACALLECVADGRPSEAEKLVGSKSLAPFIREPIVQVISKLCTAASSSVSDYQQSAGVPETLIPYTLRQKPAAISLLRRINEIGEEIVRLHITGMLRAYTAVHIDRIATLSALSRDELIEKLSLMAIDGTIPASIDTINGVINISEKDDTQISILKSVLETLKSANTAAAALEMRMNDVAAALRT